MESVRMARDNKLTKSIGEHFTCAALAQEGWAASLTRDGLARTDALAVHTESRRMIEVQVKTSTTFARPSWLLGEVRPAESNREWYVLVALGASVRDRPRCFVVPRDHVAAGVWIGHMAWLTDPGVPAGKRNTPLTRSRAGAEVWTGYEERWEALNEENAQDEVRLPEWMRDAAREDRIGLPANHPWTRSLELLDWLGAELGRRTRNGSATTAD